MIPGAKHGQQRTVLFETYAKYREQLERGRLVRVMLGFEIAGEPPALLLQRSLFDIN